VTKIYVVNAATDAGHPHPTFDSMSDAEACAIGMSNANGRGRIFICDEPVESKDDDGRPAYKILSFAEGERLKSGNGYKKTSATVKATPNRNWAVIEENPTRYSPNGYHSIRSTCG
jgi:hypothetical protein